MSLLTLLAGPAAPPRPASVVLAPFWLLWGPWADPAPGPAHDPVPAEPGALLLEGGGDGFGLLLEGGGFLLLESDGEGYFESDFLTYLGSALGVVAYPGFIPEGVGLPAATFFLLGTPRPARLSGSSGLVEARVQVSVFSQDYADCARISESLRRGLHGFSGRMGGTPVDAALLSNQVATYEPGMNADDRGTHGKVNEYVVHYRESIPNPRG